MQHLVVLGGDGMGHTNMTPHPPKKAPHEAHQTNLLQSNGAQAPGHSRNASTKLQQNAQTWKSASG